MRSEVRWVNIAKGVAIFLVVYGHAIEGLAEGGYPFASYSLQHDIIYSFHMPFFFLLIWIIFKEIVN